MELTRRDALAALAASGVAVGTGAVLGTDVEDRLLGDADDPSGTENPSDAGPFPENRLATLLAVAEVVYPSAVLGGGDSADEDASGEDSADERSGVEEFVRTYALGRTADRPDYREGMLAALSTLDEYARSWHDAAFRDLDAATRESVLDQMAVDTADPDPGGADRERVRYYAVNELLYALYSSPTGGELVGIENPQGHPGGTSSYQRGPQG